MAGSVHENSRQRQQKKHPYKQAYQTSTDKKMIVNWEYHNVSADSIFTSPVEQIWDQLPSIGQRLSLEAEEG